MTNEADTLPTIAESADAGISKVLTAEEALTSLEEMNPDTKKARGPKPGSEEEYRQIMHERDQLLQSSLREENIRIEIGALKERFNNCTRVWQD